jgi:N-acetylmuramoyl-L-alanine amidase
MRASGHRFPPRLGAALFLLGVAAVLLGACGRGSGAPDGGSRRAAPVIAVPDEAAAYALAPAALRAIYYETAARAVRVEATAAGVTLSRQAAGLARVIARREADVSFVAAARRHLREAARRARLPGACEASLELARLEAVDAADLDAAYLVAHRTVLRFGGDEALAPCVADARRTLAVLEPYRPDPAVLAAADTVPDDDGALVAEPAAAPAPAEVDVAGWAAARTAPVDGAPVLERIEVLGAPAGDTASAGAAPRARVALYFDHVAVFERGELAADATIPRRAYLDFHGAQLAPTVASATRVAAGGVERVRAARLDANTLRVAFDLEQGARYRLFFLPDPYRVVLDFERDPLEARAAAAPVTAAQGGRHALGLLVLDPGHGGDDHGARSESGLRESNVVLELAKSVKAILARRLPETRVLLTRDRDVFLSLEQRAAMANVVGADAFVSIHLNASPTPAERGGVGTFVLDTTADRASLSLAARENGTTEGEVTALERILASLQRADQAGDSRALAERLQGTTLAAGRREYPALYDRGTQSALFYVLVGARMPAVLVEASFILRAPEAPLLARGPYKQALAEGIADGLVRYARGQ